LLAIIEAVASKKVHFNIVRSTTSFSFITVVNGPIRNEIGMNSGINALGSGTGNSVNATIGRFLRLALINLGGSETGVNDMSSQGNPSKFSFAFPESEEQSPWDPFHVSRGYRKKESTVTLFFGGWAHSGNDGNIETVARYIAQWELPWGAVVIIDPLRARQLTKEGYTKSKLQNFLWKNATLTAKQFRETDMYRIFIKPALEGKHVYGGENVWPSWYLNAPDDKILQVYGRKEFISILVAGGETNPHITSWKGSLPTTVSVDKWR
jgi:hypothetical protein